MASPLLMISNHEEDVKLGKIMALYNAMQYLNSTDPNEIDRILQANDDAMVFWDCDAFQSNPDITGFLEKHSKPSHNVAITNDELSTLPQLTELPFFGHHIQRRYPEPSPTFYSRFVSACVQKKLEGLKPYFPQGTKINRIEIKQSNHKHVAIEAIQKTLTNKGIKGRLATLVAQGVDELILNAIFDAPYNFADRSRYRHRTARSTEFDLTPQETVVVEMAVCDQYLGICVIDQFGSITPTHVFRTLRAYFNNEASLGDVFTSADSGFGMNGILQSGLSLKIACEPKKRTESLIFFPVAQSFRDFKTSFRFFGAVEVGK